MSGKRYSFARKTPRQKVLFLLAWLFRSSPFLRGTDVQSFVGRILVIYWCDFRGQALLLGYCVLAWLWAENAAGFFTGVVFLGFGVSLLFLFLPLLLLLLLSGGRLGCLFFSFACSRARIPDRHPAPGQAGAASTCSLSFLSPLSARVGRPPPLFLPPSAFSLSLSLSLFSLSLFASMRLVGLTEATYLTFGE